MSDQQTPNTTNDPLRIGEYVLVQKLGEGGMGEVWLAENPLIGRKVALKILNLNLAGKGHHTERFRREAQAVNEIQHKNVVDIFSFGTVEDGRPYLVMELLRGTSLADYLKKKGPLPYREMVHIFGQLCRALQAAHDHSIIHRDLKPDNAFLVTNEDDPLFVKVLDFGIAKLVDSGVPSLTRTNAAFGTPAYMSPEQCESAKNVDHRTDIYALGIILFEMITGRTPFYTPGDGVATVFLRHQIDPVPALASMAPTREIPIQLERLLSRMLAKDRNERPARCAELPLLLQDALGSLRELASVEVRSPSTPAPNPPAATLPADSQQSSVPPAVITNPPSNGSSLKLGLGAVAALVLLGVGGWAGGIFGGGTARPPAATPLASTSAPAATSPAPASQAPSQAPQAPAAPSASQPRTVVLSFSSAPSEATVLLAGKELGKTPLVHELPAEDRDAEVVMLRGGYAEYRATVSLRATDTVRASLVPLKSTGAVVPPPNPTPNPNPTKEPTPNKEPKKPAPLPDNDATFRPPIFGD